MVYPEEGFTDSNAALRVSELKDLAECHVAMGHTAQARECYREAAELAAGDPEVRVSLGWLALKDGLAQEALASFSAAWELAPRHSEALLGVGMANQSLGALPAAFDAYLKCLETDCDNLLALLGLFQTSCEMGTFARLTYYLELYLQRHPDDAAVEFCLATLYARDNRLIDARKSILRVLQADKDKPEALELLQNLDRRLAAVTEGAA
jgi:Tfp pilus assembly protein PilF